MMRYEELEKVLLDQIEKLNQDDVMANPDESKALIERSRAMSDLTSAYVDIQRNRLEERRLTIEAVRLASNEGLGLRFERALGIEPPAAEVR